MMPFCLHSQANVSVEQLNTPGFVCYVDEQPPVIIYTNASNFNRKELKKMHKIILPQFTQPYLIEYELLKLNLIKDVCIFKNPREAINIYQNSIKKKIGKHKLLLIPLKDNLYKFTVTDSEGNVKIYYSMRFCDLKVSY